MTYRVTVSGQSTDRKMVSKCTVLTILYSPLWSVRMDGTVVLLHEVSERQSREREATYSGRSLRPTTMYKCLQSFSTLARDV